MGHCTWECGQIGSRRTNDFDSQGNMMQINLYVSQFSEETKFLQFSIIKLSILILLHT